MQAGEGPVAVIDIGSNSARIVVYRLEGGLSTQILASSRGSLELVRELDATHRLSREAQDRAFEALQDFRAIALGAGATRTFALATAAVRDAENGKTFMAEVKKRLGFDVRILSGEEEARFGFLGAVGGLPVDHGVLFDVGGGSMQVTRFRQRRITHAVSLPLGSLRLSDAFLKSDPPTSGEVRRLSDHARSLLEKAGVGPLEPGESLVGTGGTVRNLAKIDLRSRDYPVTRLHGYLLTRKSLKEVLERGRRKIKKRADIPGLNEDRGDSIVGGGLAIAALVQLLEADQVWVSGQGVREGLARASCPEDLLPPAVSPSVVGAGLAARFAGWDAQRPTVGRHRPGPALRPRPRPGRGREGGAAARGHPPRRRTECRLLRPPRARGRHRARHRSPRIQPPGNRPRVVDRPGRGARRREAPALRAPLNGKDEEKACAAREHCSPWPTTSRSDARGPPESRAR